MLEAIIDALHVTEIGTRAARLGRGLEVEAYKVYLDLWWEAQFLLDSTLLSSGLGC